MKIWDFSKPDWFLHVTPADFETAAIQLYQYQAKNNHVFSSYLKKIGAAPDEAKIFTDIRFLPISFFKTHAVQTGKNTPEWHFLSSSTSGQGRSKHPIFNPDYYIHSFTQTFNLHYGNPAKYKMYALLPGYMERGDSSLVYMVHHLSQQSQNPETPFFLNNLEELTEILYKDDASAPILLWGVTYALMDLAELMGKAHLPQLTIIETGGMKGTRKEMPKTWLHEKLSEHFIGASIHSEYGMTELLSQAYSKDGVHFQSPPWMQFHIRQANDPFYIIPMNQWGAVNVIDLANTESCAFISTDDAGRITKDGLQLAGRLDHAEIRGCHQMYV